MPRKSRKKSRARLASSLLNRHFKGTPLDQLVITERSFPFRVRADLQCALTEVLAASLQADHFSGLRKEYSFVAGIGFADCLGDERRDPVTCSPPQYEEIDVGAEQPVRCLHNGFWLLRNGELRLALVLSHAGRHEITGFRIEVAVPNTSAGLDATQHLLRQLELAVERSACYRGKILTLEKGEDYSGRTAGILVHRLREVERDQVVLPAATLELLERNVINFVHRRPDLAKRKLPTKKGLLFYGPPGTGKTHTIHYLTRALPGHTTLIITAEQVGLLDQYMTLARLLQPSIVVLEDVDLIARDRERMGSACEEVLLNKLLNHMDGLTEDADILFILTTNRPEQLESALASRPGRVDQAIEFPLPDPDGRRKLVRLYAAGLDVPNPVVDAIVKKTDRVSAAFIKELMRRAGQFQLERNGDGPLTVADVDAALDELLFKGGSLNRVLLGAMPAE
jgi:cell division protease FtsH